MGNVVLKRYMNRFLFDGFNEDNLTMSLSYFDFFQHPFPQRQRIVYLTAYYSGAMIPNDGSRFKLFVE
jgi:hypothetical protein